MPGRFQIDNHSPLLHTASLCPVCLRKISARMVQRGDETVLQKTCPEHGGFSAVIWRKIPGAPPFSSWNRPKIPHRGGQRQKASGKGCPFDCGLCPGHHQRTCTALIEITSRCNLCCPVCFAGSSREGKDLDFPVIVGMLKDVYQQTGGCNLQLSGGEPTLHSRLPEIVQSARETGFQFVQLNSNGIRLAAEPEFCQSLAQAGLDSVFLQFDGLRDSAHLALRGRALAEVKAQAIANLKAAGIGIVLVPVVVPGVNDDALWEIIRYALDCGSQVRGVHFQPISYFGRFPQDCSPTHITLPELMVKLTENSCGMLVPGDFVPPGCEHALCSFSARYLRQDDGGLTRLGRAESCDCTPKPALQGAIRAIDHTARQWRGVAPVDEPPPPHENELDRFLRRAKRDTFQISAMAFMDAWTLDLARLQGCCIHIAQQDGRLLPFCAANFTSFTGVPLHGRKR